MRVELKLKQLVCILARRRSSVCSKTALAIPSYEGVAFPQYLRRHWRSDEHWRRRVLNMHRFLSDAGPASLLPSCRIDPIVFPVIRARRRIRTLLTAAMLDFSVSRRQEVSRQVVVRHCGQSVLSVQAVPSPDQVAPGNSCSISGPRMIVVHSVSHSAPDS